MSMPHFNTDADQIIKSVAQQIAYEYEIDFVGTEHILLAILRHGHGLGAEVLRSFDLDEGRVRAEIDEQLQREKEDTWVFGRLPGSPHYRNVVELAIDEATQLESNHIGSEHLLLGLLREPGSMAYRVLAKLGVSLAACRERILERLSA
jgi:ATP-dependent Clp protease ATP-binding subunit ClpC